MTRTPAAPARSSGDDGRAREEVRVTTLLTEDEFRARAKLSLRRVREMRRDGTGPRFVRGSRARAFYPLDEVESWEANRIRAQLYQSTAHERRAREALLRSEETAAAPR